MSVRAAHCCLNSFALIDLVQTARSLLPMELRKEPHPECDPDLHVPECDPDLHVPWSDLVPWIVSSCLNLVPGMRAQKKKRRDCDDRAKKNKKKQDLFPSPQIGGWLACCSALPPTQHQQLEPCCSSLPPHNTSSSAPPLSKPGRSGPSRFKVRRGRPG